MRKVYVDMTAEFDETGTIMPKYFRYENGIVYKIDRVLSIQKRAALKTGGAGLRYTCRIKNRDKYIFLEENRWFVETDK
ncbi:hypothetical protein MUJ63_12375 [Lachnospiraceae bacterium NSJ-143]|nr:hypothetical protein [Lachnospiraceae bacterium NSJ-143]